MISNIALFFDDVSVWEGRWGKWVSRMGEFYLTFLTLPYLKVFTEGLAEQMDGAGELVKRYAVHECILFFPPR